MIKPIKNKKEYKASLKRIYELMHRDLKTNSDEYNELEVLSILVESYEEKSFPISKPDPIEAIKFRLEQLNLNKSALNEILGSKSRASEILSRKRKLSLEMIRKINKKLSIPAEVLINDYHSKP